MSQTSTLEKLTGLKRRLDILVPSSEVDQAYQTKLQKVAKSAKVDGFRPGKVPMTVVEQRYGNSIFAEIAQELMQSYLVKAIDEHKLQIVDRPMVNPKELKRGEALSFSAEFEVYPEIELTDMSQVAVTKPVLDLQEADIEKMLETLQKQHIEWQEVDRAAKNGDQVEIDFEGFLNGEPFDKGKANNFKLELGSNKMIPGFEEQLVNIKAGETREIECDFPEDYPSEDLKGQKTLFKIKAHKVSEPKLPELNDDFVKKLGLDGGMKALRDEVEKNMRAQVGQVLKDKLKMEVMDKLLEHNTVTVPDSLIEGEIKHLKEAMKQKMEQQGMEASDDQLPGDAEFKDQALRRVTLGLILGEVIKAHELKVDSQKVREKVEQIASVYHDPAQVVNWYYNNKQMLAEVESVVLEDQAVDKIVETCQVEEKKVSYDEAVKPPVTK